MAQSIYHFVNIDEQLSISRYQWYWWAIFILTFMIVLSCIALPISYQILLMILVVLCLILGQLMRYQLVTISSVASKQIKVHSNLGIDNIEWQLGLAQGLFNIDNADVHQATLEKIIKFGQVLVLLFDVYEPLKKQIVVMIWQDQCTSQTWQQLNTLAQLQQKPA